MMWAKYFLCSIPLSIPKHHGYTETKPWVHTGPEKMKSLPVERLQTPTGSLLREKKNFRANILYRVVASSHFTPYNRLLDISPLLKGCKPFCKLVDHFLSISLSFSWYRRHKQDVIRFRFFLPTWLSGAVRELCAVIHWYVSALFGSCIPFKYCSQQFRIQTFVLTYFVNS